MKKHLPLLLSFFALSLPLFTRAQVIVTVAGAGTEGYTGNNGSALHAEMNWPNGVALDRHGVLYIADADNNVIRKVSNGIITTVAGDAFRAGSGYGDFAGDGGQATDARLFFPSGIAIDTVGRIFIADLGNNCIRMVDTSGIITTVAGTGGAGFFGYMGDGGPAPAALLNRPTRVALDTFQNLYIADAGNSCIRAVNHISGTITTIAGTGVSGFGGDGGPASAAQLDMANDVAVDRAGNVFIADTYNNRIRQIDGTGNINTIAGTGISGFSGDGGPATAAYLFQPIGIALDTFDNVYFSDLGNQRVRKITPVDTIYTIAGTDTAGFNGDGLPATATKLWFPEGLAAITNTNIYVADRGNFRVRLISSTVNGVQTVNNNNASVSLYPNPNQGAFTISVNSIFDEEAQITISNVTGEKLSETTARTNAPLSIKLNEAPGIYFLSAVTGHGVSNEKLIIK